MTEREVTEEIRKYGWDYAVNTGLTFNDFEIYKCLKKDKPGTVLTTGEPTYALVKGDKVCSPRDYEEYEAIMCIVNGVAEIDVEGNSDEDA